MKKLLVIFMALCLSFAIVSCGKKETNKTTTGSNSVETTKNIVSTGTIASKEEL
jgi:lipoprotein